MAARDKLLSNALYDLAKKKCIWQSSLVDALKQVTRECAECLKLHRVAVWELSDDLSEMQLKMLYCFDTQRFESGEILSTRRYPRYLSALMRQPVVDVHHVQSDPRAKELLESYLKPNHICSFLDAAISYEGKVHGVVSFAQVGSNRIWGQPEINFVTSIADLVAQLIMVKAMRENETRYQALFEASGDAIFLVVNGVIRDSNPAAVRMFRCQRHELLGLSPEAVSPEFQADGSRSSQAAVKRIAQALDGQVQHFPWRHKRLDGTEFDTDVTLSAVQIEGEFCLIGVVRDVTDKVTAQNELLKSRLKLERLAYQDSLTLLPNREAFHSQMVRYIREAEHAGKGLAVLLLDLNRFKEVNNTLGHSFGDKLLAHVSSVIQSVFSGSEIALFRLGGDEFAMVLPQTQTEAEVLGVAERLIDCLSEPLLVEDMNLELGGSLGIAMYPAHGNNSHSLLRCADVAMYHAKNHSSSVSIYDAHYDSHSKRRLALVAELGRAIREDQLFLQYQPRVSLATGVCIGCEALVRWQHPEHGLVPPGDFIPAAEMSNVIHPLSEWVVEHALRQVKLWLDQGIDLTVSVNLSARNLTHLGCANVIASLLRKIGVSPAMLEVEITESALITDPQRALQVVDELKRLGVALSIDDFGTGYSSMSYLKRLPVTILKIDRSFVKDMLVDEGDAVIVRSTINLAHSFGIQAVAEGVEDQATLQRLKELYCDQAQGFFIARPMLPKDLEEWLGKHDVRMTI